MEVILSHAQKEPPPLSALRPGCPRKLERLARACLAKKPIDRPASAAAVATELEEIALELRPPDGCEGRAALVRTVVSAVVAPRRAAARSAPGRSRAPSALLPVGLIVAVAAGLLIVRSRPPPPRPERADSAAASVGSKRLEEARRRLSSIDRKGPVFVDSPDDREALGLLLRSGGDTQSGCETLARLLDAPPRADEDLWLQGAAGNLDARLQPLARALRARGRSPAQQRSYLPEPRVAALLARIQALAGRRVEAVATASEALRSAPGSVALHAVLLELGAPPVMAAFTRYVNDLDGSAMVWVPPGAFTMGAASSDPRATAPELPAHTVTLGGFFIDVYKVSVKRFAPFNAWILSAKDHRRCPGDSPCRKRLGSIGHLTWGHHSVRAASMAGPSAGDTLAATALESPMKQFEPGALRHPVTSVNWFDAVAFARWAGNELPTEAQWEKTARGTEGRLYPWGNAPPSPALAKFGDDGLFRKAVDIDTFEAVKTAYGAVEMAGNVWEWCGDEYDERAYRERAGRNVTDPLVGPGKLGSRHRSQRGGASYSDYWQMRCTTREKATPEFSSANSWGFRTVRRLRPLPQR